ncbi:MAG: hypothetical protein JO025_22925 [Verrucomicrobia bacterium]|nr:hypothetical protein [Verrucomicrobiota bacterium]
MTRAPIVSAQRLEGSRFSLLRDFWRDRAKNHGVTQRGAAGGSRKRLLVLPRSAARPFEPNDRIPLGQFTRGDVSGSRLLFDGGQSHAFSREHTWGMTAVKGGSPPGAGRA